MIDSKECEGKPQDKKVTNQSTASVCICGRNSETNVKVDVEKVSEIIENVIKSQGQGATMTIKISIEITKE